MSKKRKVRTDFRKNRSERPRPADFTRQFEAHGFENQDPAHEERIGKSDLTRRRVVVTEVGTESGQDDLDVLRDIDRNVCFPGRVLRVMGLFSHVQVESGKLYRCATRRILKTLSTDQRHVVAAGDRVWIRPERDDEGMIERVEPRRGVLSRNSRGRQHVIATNLDQIVIVASAAEPRIKPGLIDRFLLTAEQNRLSPLIVINKVDLVEPAEFAPLAGVYSQMGYRVLLVSAVSRRWNAAAAQDALGPDRVVAGQSGVGKSSLLNAIEPGLGLRVGEVSEENEKGKHTTTTAQLVPLAAGGFVVDTPGIRQFQLWDIDPREICGYFRDVRSLANRCRFPDCSHTHEEGCAVKHAVADELLDERRYESYVKLFAGDMD